jgi:hypothetical protein
MATRLAKLRRSLQAAADALDAQADDFARTERDARQTASDLGTR